MYTYQRIHCFRIRLMLPQFLHFNVFFCFSHLTMEKLLEGLKVKTKLECEDALRQLMCAINGMII